MRLVAALDASRIHSVVGDMEISPATERLQVGAAAIFMSSGGPRNGQEAVRVEVYPRSRTAARAGARLRLSSCLGVGAMSVSSESLDRKAGGPPSLRTAMYTRRAPRPRPYVKPYE